MPSAAWYPVYSPDGRWIAFEGRRGNDSAIYVANPLTGTVTPLLQEKRAEQRPRWSRDGRRVYFTSDSTGRYEIWSVEVDGKGKAGAVAQVTHEGVTSLLSRPMADSFTTPVFPRRRFDESQLLADQRSPSPA